MLQRRVVLFVAGLTSSIAFTLGPVPTSSVGWRGPWGAQLRSTPTRGVSTLTLNSKQGQGGGDINDALRGLSASLPSPGTLLFWGGLFLFPGLIFGLITNLLTAIVVVPVVAFAAFQFWVATSTQEAACPQCGAQTSGFNNGEPTQCLACGEPLVAEVGASPPRWLEQTVFEKDPDSFTSRSQAGGDSAPSNSGEKNSGNKKEPSDFIDAEVL